MMDSWLVVALIWGIFLAALAVMVVNLYRKSSRQARP